MKLNLHARLDYQAPEATDILLHIEAALCPDQIIEQAHIHLPGSPHIARVPAQDGIGERIWLQVEGQFVIEYEATVSIQRTLADIATLQKTPHYQLPGETVPYLMASRYCPSDRFHDFVTAEFGTLDHGPLVLAMRQWIVDHLHYTPGSSDAMTTAADTFISRHGICRDYAHLLITFARAAGIPARIASVYALKLDPPDFHAVAEVFLDGAWHLIDATALASEAAMVRIGIGRDAADVAFLTSFGPITMNAQSVMVESSGRAL